MYRAAFKVTGQLFRIGCVGIGLVRKVEIQGCIGATTPQTYIIIPHRCGFLFITPKSLACGRFPVPDSAHFKKIALVGNKNKFR